MPVANITNSTIPEVVVGQGGAEQQRVLRLTVLYHPDISRIGEVADLTSLLSGEPARLGRLDLSFRSPRGRGARRPLLDQYLSRKPLSLSWNEPDLAVELPVQGNSVSLDGELVFGSRRLHSSEVDRGVVMVLARRVVLLLHAANTGDVAADDCGLVGESDLLQGIRQHITRVAASHASVLLLGESGTGKELVATAIHDRSARAGSAMVSVNMGAIPQELAAAELFGVCKGAYTGADQDKPGYFQRADGATLFLDEIGASANSVQVQLLRALQSGEIQSPGGVVRRVDVRVISATDAELNGSGDKAFNIALKHRLAAFEINLPPLRARREDIGRLVRHSLGDFMVQPRFSEPAVAGQWALLFSKFARYHWPGNVRELLNFCQQIQLASAGDASLCIPENVLDALQSAAGTVHQPTQMAHRQAAQVADFEVREAMASEGNEVSRAARRLNISRPALYRRIHSIADLRLVSDISTAEITGVYQQFEADVDAAAEHLGVSRVSLRTRWRALELEARDG
jgi:two-component system nitrogen regulation response regulator GlnG